MAYRVEVAAGGAQWHGPLLLTAFRPDDRGDVAWAKRLANGDPEALQDLYDQFGRRVQSLALHILADRGEAEDMVQETFLEVWKRRREFDAARGSVAAWILTIARSRSLTRLESRRSAQRRETTAAMEQTIEPVAAASPLEGTEDRMRLAGALAQVPVDQRRVIELAYFEGMSHQEIADATGDPLGTVKTRLRLGMQKLSRFLLGGGDA